MMKFVLAYHQLLLTILSERMFNNSWISKNKFHHEYKLTWFYVAANLESIHAKEGIEM